MLIKDLALILGSAGIVTLIFKRLKQPLVLGYILAGLFVGPNTNLYPTIGDLEGVHVWGEIGVIFLLFALGLEFSFKKLIKAGGSSSITAFVQIICMIFLGYYTGRLMDWSAMDSIFLGAMLSMSSTTIIIRAFEELNYKTKNFASLVFGALIIEDLVAIVLMVLLSTIAVSREFAGWDMLFSITKLLFFLILWFVSGIFFIPTFLTKAKRLMNEETMLITAVALCFVMVFIASQAGFSPALGAFIMGSILAETKEGTKIEHLVKPVKDLFGAIFFVSVGMMINPRTLLDYSWPIVIVTLITIVGKTLGTMLGALISGQPLKESVQAGMSLAQIGEFSFIIASLGLTLKVTSDFIYPVIVAVSGVTTFTTPYMMQLANPLYDWLRNHLPKSWLQAIERYSSGTQTIQAETDWKKVIRAYLSIIITNGVVILAVILLASYYLTPFVRGRIENNIVANLTILFVTLCVISPFLWALMVKRVRSEHSTSLWLDKKYNRGPLLMLEAARNITAVLLVGFLFRQLFPFWISIGIAALILVVVLFIFSRRLQDFYHRIEKRFISNLNERESIRYEKGDQDLSPWDAHFAYFDVHPNMSFIGKTLEELAWREKYGINIASIDRGGHFIKTPTRTEVLYPYDKIGVIGTDMQLQQFRPVIEDHASSGLPAVEEDLILAKIIVDSHNHLTGKTIRNSEIRERTNGLVVGIERDGERILNPHSDTQFEWDDIVWIVGDRDKIEKL